MKPHRYISSFKIAYREWIAGVFCLLTSCGFNNEAEAGIPDVSSAEQFESVSEHEKPATPRRLEFASPEEIKNYLALSPDSAEYRTGILIQMATDAPSYVDSLLNARMPRFLVVDKAKMKVLVFDKYGHIIKTFRMACAKRFGNKHVKGDSRTPEGFFRVEGVYNSTEWLYTDDNGVTSEVIGQYGPRFIRIKTTPHRWPIGIHGTNAPWSVGGRRSHGCIRLKNEDIMELVKLVEKGMPVIISPSLKDMQVNREEHSPTPRIWTGGDLKAITRKAKTAKAAHTATDTTPASPTGHPSHDAPSANVNTAVIDSL